MASSQLAIPRGRPGPAGAKRSSARTAAAHRGAPCVDQIRELVAPAAGTWAAQVRVARWSPGGAPLCE